MPCRCAALPRVLAAALDAVDVGLAAAQQLHHDACELAPLCLRDGWVPGGHGEGRLAERAESMGAFWGTRGCVEGALQQHCHSSLARSCVVCSNQRDEVRHRVQRREQAAVSDKATDAGGVVCKGL